MINVTKTYLPPLEDYTKYLKMIWASNQLTNNGQLVQELESKLKEYLRVENLIYVSNGTMALQLAIKASGLTGEIITTPFSYVATTSSILWEKCTPVFVDIDESTLCIDPGLIEDAVNPRTEAILATHVYGFPCNLDAIGDIARAMGLKVIYDGSHAFGVKYLGDSIFNFGDISTLSFHATKVFHTVEGGAVVTKDKELAHRISSIRNFGHEGPEAFSEIGINAKNSEFHAAMGLCVLPGVENFIKERKKIAETYSDMLTEINIVTPTCYKEVSYNYAYYPVIFSTENALIDALKVLNENYIYPRRYFYPSLNKLPYIGSKPMPVSEDIAKRILCLPIFHDLSVTDVRLICDIIKQLYI